VLRAGEKRHLELLQKNCPAPQQLVLKAGCQVMLLKVSLNLMRLSSSALMAHFCVFLHAQNLDQKAGLVNGSRGVVVGFSPEVAEDYGQSAPAGLYDTDPPPPPLL
jgi:hypothetical protein